MGARVIILDAEPAGRFRVGAILEYDGYEITQTDDPVRVLHLVKSDPPDLIITDGALPDITCHEVIHLFRRHLPEIPVLMLSGLPDYEIMMRCKRERYEFFRKPFKPSQLRAKVREVLARAVAKRSSAA
jgi:DNA-binding response OmpR family regulator